MQIVLNDLKLATCVSISKRLQQSSLRLVCARLHINSKTFKSVSLFVPHLLSEALLSVESGGIGGRGDNKSICLLRWWIQNLDQAFLNQHCKKSRFGCQERDKKKKRKKEGRRYKTNSLLAKEPNSTAAVWPANEI